MWDLIEQATLKVRVCNLWSQVVMLYSLNFYSAVCQLYFNKIERIKLKEKKLQIIQG